MTIEVQVPDSVTGILQEPQPLEAEAFNALTALVRGSARLREKFHDQLIQLVAAEEQSLASDLGKTCKIGQLYYVLGKYAEAVEWLSRASQNAEALFLQARCLRSLRRFDQAIEVFGKAAGQGKDQFIVNMAIVDCRRASGDLDGAGRDLEAASGSGEIRAEYHYQRGRLLNVLGDHEEAMNAYDRATQLDAQHADALFHLAYTCDLYNESDEAIELYERCLECGRVHVNALLNLAVLYEDHGEFDKAMHCIRRVLAAYPNHPRARLFYKDIESSTTMYYDEEQEKRIDRRNQVLEIPISDFELSVRSRNCLKKMNIRTLGDLLRVTEAELLAYKNFGETSLQEIKQILSQKNLRLGQMLEEHNIGMRRAGMVEEGPSAEENELLNTSIAELDLSIRARKALQRLNLQTIGELIRCTEAELLGCKNFGQMSLNEIKLKLKERNLALRSLDH